MCRHHFRIWSDFTLGNMVLNVKYVLWSNFCGSWRHHLLHCRQFAPSPTLESFRVLERVCNHRKNVTQKFETYFPDNFRYRRKNSYFSFQVTVGLNGNSVILVCLYSVFCLQWAVNYPNYLNNHWKLSCSFQHPVFVRKDFSSLLQLKTKYRNGLSACAILRLNLTNIEPDIQELFKAQPPHWK
jgi:hypothetical protein